MINCSCWQEKKVCVGWYGNEPIYKTFQICTGTKECDECSCNGDAIKCNFYPQKRKENKTMNTAEMWIKAQEDGYCYEMVIPQSSSDRVFYQKDEGLFDEDNFQIIMDNFESFDEFMNEQWQLRVMTKSEAETKFNIKIVGD